MVHFEQHIAIECIKVDPTLEVTMSKGRATKRISSRKVRTAIKKLADHQFHARMRRVTGNEASVILPEIWPVIQELCLISDACEVGMIEVNR